MRLRVRGLLPVVVLATIVGVFVPVSGAAQQLGVCQQAIAEAGTGQGTYGRYTLVQAPAVGRSKSQVVVGTDGPDQLVGGSGSDVLCGLGGNDLLLGGSGDDYLDGGDGSDLLKGGSGHDVLDGGEGPDELQGGSGDDLLDGAAAFDRLFGGSGHDTLRNGEVNDGGSGRNEVAPAPQVDISASMPRSMRDEITGDFLGRGYDQRMRVEGDANGNYFLKIYDSPSRGGELLQSTPGDLATPPKVQYGCGDEDEQICNANTWSQWSQPSSISCDGCFFNNYWNPFHFGTVYLAHNSTNIFMAGTKGNTVGTGGVEYQNVVNVLPAGGSCATQSCAEAVISLPTMFNNCDSCTGEVRSITVTSLATGNIGSTPYLAVGLSDGGVQIYNVSDPSSPQLTGTFTGNETGVDDSQTPPTALAWDPSGSGLLAVGVVARSDLGFFVKVNADGSIPGNWLAWGLNGGLELAIGVLSTAFGQRQDGTPVVAFGLNDGTVRLIDPLASGRETEQLAQSSPVNGVNAINPIPRFDGSSGGSDFAVSYQVTAGANMVGNGGLLRWDGTSANLTALPVTAGSPNTVTADWDEFRAWYPGIKQGRLRVDNSSGEPVTVTLHAASDSSSGCWYAPAWADSPAFPTAGIALATGQTSATYVMGAYTAGPDGSCAATSNADIWRGYLVITPVDHPADTRLVRLRLNRDLTVDVENQAGGATSVSVAQTPPHMSAFGLWTITVDTPAAPTPLAAPTVTPSRITPAAMTGPAVYRFDVTGASYTLANPYADQMAIPPLIVAGSVDGATWTELGALVPATAPTIVASGSQFELQLGPATFWWENASGQTAYEQIRVGFGSDGPQSAVVTLADVAAPPVPTNVTGAQISAPIDGAPVTPVDSGLDQAPMSVEVLGAVSSVLPPNDPSYQRIYYREELTTALITNLFPTAGGEFLGVSPYAGAYPNNGSAGGGQPGAFDGFHYVATTSPNPLNIIGHVVDHTGHPQASQPIEVRPTRIAPVNNSSSPGVIMLAGCTDTVTNTCLLAQPTSAASGALSPAMYLDTSNGVLIGLLTAVQATTAVSSLPLRLASGSAEHLLASATLTLSDTAATLTDTSAFLQGDRVDTNLVTHGMLVPVVNIPVS